MECALLGIVMVCLAAYDVEGINQYKAAVVEFSPNQLDPPKERIKKNLNGFNKTLSGIERDVQVVVFPEDAILGAAYFSRKAITSYLEAIPDVSPSGLDFIVPCGNNGFKDRPVLQTLSCLAQQYSVLLVANMGDIQECDKSSSSCPSDGHFQFNTNVVFEKDGSLIAKYHKVNLYAGEKTYFDSGNLLSSHTCVSFTASFGVTFGTFTCYDILFSNPADCLLEKGIKHFVLPTEWGSAYPFYMSIAVQQSWSRKHAVNLLAANQHFKLSYSSGSGLYTNGYAMNYFISGNSWETSSGKAIVAKLPVDIDPAYKFNIIYGNRKNVENISCKSRDYLNFTLLSSSNGSITSTYTEAGLSLECKLDYVIKTTATNEVYALGAYIGDSDGAKKHDSSLCYAICSLMKCASSKKCGEPVEGYETKTIFDSVHLQGNFPADSEVYGSALNTKLALPNPADPSLSIDTKPNSLKIMAGHDPLLCANLWSRLKL